MKTKFHLFLVTISDGSTAGKLPSRDTRAENMMCLVTVPLAAPSVQRRKKNSVLCGSNWHVSLPSRRRLRARFKHGKSNLRDGTITNGTYRENREPPNIDVNTRLLRYHVLQLFPTDVTRKCAHTHRCQNISTADTRNFLFVRLKTLCLDYSFCLLPLAAWTPAPWLWAVRGPWRGPEKESEELNVSSGKKTTKQNLVFDFTLGLIVGRITDATSYAEMSVLTKQNHMWTL